MNDTILMTDDAFAHSYTMRRYYKDVGVSPYDPPAWQWATHLKAHTITEAMQEAEELIYVHHLEKEPVDTARHYVLWQPKHDTSRTEDIRHDKDKWRKTMDVFVTFHRSIRSSDREYEAYREFAGTNPFQSDAPPRYYPSGYIWDADKQLYVYHEG